MMHRLAVVLAVAAVLAPVTVALQLQSAIANNTGFVPTVTQSTIFSDTKQFPYVHMTMIETVADGVMVAAFQASTKSEGSLDQRIMFTSSTDGGKTWANATEIVKGDNVPVWGPAFLFSAKQNRLFLFFSKSVPQNKDKTNADKHKPGGDIYMTFSDDNGKTWDTKNEKLIVPYTSKTLGNISKMTANRPVFLTTDEQEFALPIWQEEHNGEIVVDATGPSCARVLTTLDGGKTFQASAEITHQTKTNSWFIENSIAAVTALPASKAFGVNETEAKALGRTEPLRLLQVFRTQLDSVYMSQSVDGGKTWSALETTLVPNPDSKVYLASRQADGANPARLVLALNPTTKGRDTLAVIVSDVNATYPEEIDFSMLATIAKSDKVESSYPTLLALGGPSSTRWAVSYSADSTSAAVIAFFDAAAMPAGGDSGPKTNNGVAMAITFGIIGIVTAALVGVMIIGYLQEKANKASGGEAQNLVSSA